MWGNAPFLLGVINVFFYIFTSWLLTYRENEYFSLTIPTNAYKGSKDAIAEIIKYSDIMLSANMTAGVADVSKISAEKAAPKIIRAIVSFNDIFSKVLVSIL